MKEKIIRFFKKPRNLIITVFVLIVLGVIGNMQQVKENEEKQKIEMQKAKEKEEKEKAEVIAKEKELKELEEKSKDFVETFNNNMKGKATITYAVDHNAYYILYEGQYAEDIITLLSNSKNEVAKQIWNKEVVQGMRGFSINLHRNFKENTAVHVVSPIDKETILLTTINGNVTTNKIK